MCHTTNIWPFRIYVVNLKSSIRKIKMQQYIFKVFPQVFQDTFDCKNNIKDLKLV